MNKSESSSYHDGVGFAIICASSNMSPAVGEPPKTFRVIDVQLRLQPDSCALPPTSRYYHISGRPVIRLTIAVWMLNAARVSVKPREL